MIPEFLFFYIHKITFGLFRPGLSGPIGVAPIVRLQQQIPRFSKVRPIDGIILIILVIAMGA